MISSDFTIGFTIAILLLFTYYHIDNFNSDLVYVHSTVDGQRYLVRNLDDKQQAANTLATIKINLVNLNDTLKVKYPKDPAINRLISKFNPDKIIEVEQGSKYTSYSVNKGEKMVLCMRSRSTSVNTDTLENQNTIMFVAIHELAHIMTESVGHTDEFWGNFKFLLKHATRLGIYKNVDYGKQPEEYCGIEVTDSPLNDTNIKEALVVK
jgi:hypothetical protein